MSGDKANKPDPTVQAITGIVMGREIATAKVSREKNIHIPLAIQGLRDIQPGDIIVFYEPVTDYVSDADSGDLLLIEIRRERRGQTVIKRLTQDDVKKLGGIPD